MSEMKLWGARDDSGGNNVFRADCRPAKESRGVYINALDQWLIHYNGKLGELACSGVPNGQCREIKTLDLINWTVEYVPDPPTLKEAWKVYSRGERWELRTHGTDPYSELIKALQREFPDE